MKRKQINNPNQLFIDFDSIIENKNLTGSIDQILPELYPEQREDVLLAEKRFENGKGILFTNGTGTGKTFTGLGIIKRFIIENKNNILIVVPTDKKAKDWIDEGKQLSLEIYQLKSINDVCNGIIVTTYSNFYQNEAIENIDFNLVIYDESHYLLQNQKGDYTNALYKHQRIAKLPSSFNHLYQNELRNQCYYIDKEGDERFDEKKFKVLYNTKIKQYCDYTKVVFLSATPFAYHKSIMLGDGTLWNINEKTELTEDKFYGYNDTDDYESFFVENFGYRMRYNRLTTPDSKVDLNLMERNFFEKYRIQGVISGRQIDVDKDYSREFIIVNSNIGKTIDEGRALFYDKKFREKYKYLSQYAYRKFNYLYMNQLLECIKAQEVKERIEQHLDLGRKVVIFHSYNNSLPEHPFKFRAEKLLRTEEDNRHKQYLEEDIANFEQEYSNLVNMDISSLVNPIQAIREAFPNHTNEFNGMVSKNKRLKNIDVFNDPKSNMKILLVQVKAGKEGISLHDIVGDYPRVLITLGLPVAPTDAIQIEGRIYRLGVESNAIYEYITLQTNFERIAFASKIAERSRTAENLAMGFKARNLELAFKEGYQNAHSEVPNLKQGVGGKKSDFTFNLISEFDQAKTFYYGQLQKKSSNKSREGVDYYATPEPLGYKMVEWLNLQPGDRVLEPSAGHGAIARFFPENTENVCIEASYDLSSKLMINTKADVKIQRFENYYIGNKFEAIVMNPPFGVGGKQAMEHLEKAMKHMSYFKSKLIAIIPNGVSMQKRLDKFFNDEDKSKGYYLTYEIILPSCVFERAGTSVWCKIIVIEKDYDNEFPYTNQMDFSGIKNVDDFFDKIEDFSIFE